jgi:peptidyl-prolyl cis-trans isomerase D
LLAQIFAAEIGEDGDPFATKNGATYVLKVDGVIPPKVKSLDTVRADATAAWTAEQRSALLAKKADGLVAQTNAQKSLTAAAAAARTPILKSGALRRPIGQDTGNTPNLPATLVEKIFSVPPGQAVAGPSADGSSFIVARVTGVAHPAVAANALQFLDGSSKLSKQAAEDLSPVMANAARAAQGVQINQANVDRVTGEGS